MQEMQRRMLDVLEANASLTDKLLANKTREGQTPTFIQSYAYTASFSNVGPVDPATSPPGTQVQVPTAGDSDFLIFFMSSAWFNHSTNVINPTPQARLQVSDNASQRTMYSSPSYTSNVTGSNGFPYLLQDSKLVPANTILLVTLYNDMIGAGISIDGQVMFGGFRIFYNS